MILEIEKNFVITICHMQFFYFFSNLGYSKANRSYSLKLVSLSMQSKLKAVEYNQSSSYMHYYSIPNIVIFENWALLKKRLTLFEALYILYVQFYYH